MLRNIGIRLAQREAALEELSARFDMLKATSYDKAGGGRGGAGDDAIAALVAQMDAMRASWAAAAADWRAEVDAFERALRHVDARYDALLTARYVRCLRWADIAAAMDYETSYVRGRLATAALAALFDAMPPHLRAIPPATED